MTTLDTFRETMARSGLLLPTALVNDLNRREQTRQLQGLAALAATAQAHDPEEIYQALDRTFQLEHSGIFDLSALLVAFLKVRSQRLKDLAPPPFPVERLGLEDGDMEAMDREEASRLAIPPDILDGPLTAEQQAVFTELIAEAKATAEHDAPWRVGVGRAASTPPGPIGPEPREEVPILPTS
jgi:hypothetical protein